VTSSRLSKLRRGSPGQAYIYKSWKRSVCGESSGLHRFVGDFVSVDHLFIDLVIHHPVQLPSPQSALHDCDAQCSAPTAKQNHRQSIKPHPMSALPPKAGMT